jgi:nitrate reductase cytochrome c-type subunit
MTWHRVSLLAVGLLMLGPGAAAQDGTQNRSNLRPRRLYFGAPPAAPHETGGLMSDCLLCHGPGSFAPESPHPTRLSCRQCHVGSSEGTSPFRASRFVPLVRPPRSLRIQPEGPPLMPHSALLHENCLVCHAPGAREEVIATSHPERSHCQQCHVPVRAEDARFVP